MTVTGRPGAGTRRGWSTSCRSPLYYLVWRRAGKPPVQWGRLALIIGLAVAVLLISAR